MKTFIYDKIEQLERFKLTIDVKAVLCRTAWLVPNDEEKRIEYIFKKDGSIVMSSNGIVSYGTWTFEPLIMALFIKSNDITMNFKPLFYDDNLLALNLDGTNSLLFLVNQSSKLYVNSIDYQKSVAYLEEKEKEKIDALKKDDSQKRIHKQTYLNSARELRKQYNIYRNLHKSEIVSIRKRENKILFIAACFSVFLGALVYSILYYLYCDSMDDPSLLFLLSISFAISPFIIVILKIIRINKEKSFLSMSDFYDKPLEERLILIHKEDLLK